MERGPEMTEDPANNPPFLSDEKEIVSQAIASLQYGDTGWNFQRCFWSFMS